MKEAGSGCKPLLIKKILEDYKVLKQLSLMLQPKVNAFSSIIKSLKISNAHGI